MRSSVRIAPLRPSSTPASAASSTLGLKPAAITTMSAARSSIDLTAAPVRDGGDAGAGADLDVALLAEILGRVDDELLGSMDTALDEVGEAASAIGDDRPLFQDGDGELWVDAAGTGGGAEAGGNASD